MEAFFLNALFVIISIFSSSTASANERTLQNPNESEVLYFKTLPYLERVDEIINNIHNIRNQLPANTDFPSQTKAHYKEEAALLIKQGVPFLKRSAEEGNPAAQYRLALMYSTFESHDQIAQKVCTLLKSSFSSGFTPAGLQMFSYCFDDVKAPDFRSLVDALPDDEDFYSKYYPQPTLMPTCNEYRRKDNDAITPLDEKGLRANLYMSLADQKSTPSFREDKIKFLNKAAGYGCARAIEELKVQNW